jgi:hypothetical protein
MARKECPKRVTYKADEITTFATANGTVESSEKCQQQIETLGITVEADVLPETPSVLSMGKHCMEDGFDFIWMANKKPFLKSPYGEIIICDLVHNVPYLVEKIPKGPYAAPAEASSSAGPPPVGPTPFREGKGSANSLMSPK